MKKLFETTRTVSIKKMTSLISVLILLVQIILPSFSFAADTVKPVFYQITPQNGYIKRGDRIKIIAYDNVGIRAILYKLNGATSWEFSYDGTMSQYYTLYIDTNNLPLGINTLDLSAQDEAKNVSTLHKLVFDVQENITVTTETNPPVVIHDVPDVVYNHDGLKYTITATDESGIQSISYRWRIMNATNGALRNTEYIVVNDQTTAEIVIPDFAADSLATLEILTIDKAYTQVPEGGIPFYQSNTTLTTKQVQINTIPQSPNVTYDPQNLTNGDVTVTVQNSNNQYIVSKYQYMLNSTNQYVDIVGNQFLVGLNDIVSVRAVNIVNGIEYYSIPTVVDITNIDKRAPIITIDSNSQNIIHDIYSGIIPMQTKLEGVTVDEGSVQDIIVTDNINYTIPGSYQIAFDISDQIGNVAITKYKNVKLIDSTSLRATLQIAKDKLVEMKADEGTGYNQYLPSLVFNLENKIIEVEEFLNSVLTKEQTDIALMQTDLEQVLNSCVKNPTSNNAFLETLSITLGTKTYSIPVDETETEYNIGQIGYDFSTMGINAKVQDRYATINNNNVVNSNGEFSYVVNIQNVGEMSTFTILVKAYDGTERTYTLNVYRKYCAVARMSSINILDNNGDQLILDPVFSENTTAYKVVAPYTMQYVSVSNILTKDNGTVQEITFNGNVVNVNDNLTLLNTQINELKVKVLSQDGLQSLTYTIEIYKLKDSLAPVVVFNKNVLVNNSIDVTVSVTDTDAGIAEVRYALQDFSIDEMKDNLNAFVTLVNLSNDKTYTQLFNVPAGTTITVYVKDADGNENLYKKVLDIIDDGKPNLLIQLSSSFATNTNVYIYANATDNVSVNNSSFRYAKLTDIGAGLTTDDVVNENQSIIDYFRLGNGLIMNAKVAEISENGIYVAYVEDDAGNYAINYIEVNNIDKIDPTLQNVILTQNGSEIFNMVNDIGVDEITITNANDIYLLIDNTDAYYIAYTLNGLTPIRGNAYQYDLHNALSLSNELNSKMLKNGNYELAITIYDEAGNRISQNIVKIKVDIQLELVQL